MKKQSQTQKMIQELKARQKIYEAIYRTKQFYERESNPPSLMNQQNSNDDKASKPYKQSKKLKSQDQKSERHQLTLQQLSCENQTMAEKQEILQLDFGLLSGITITFLILFGLMIWFARK